MMKKANLLKAVAMIVMMTTGYSVVGHASENQPPAKEVVIGLNDVYVPAGFDSEADAYVIVNGIFPNGCYRWSSAEVKNDGQFNHEVKSKAMVSQGMCIMVLIPFTKEVRLGKLASGDHKLKFVNGDGTWIEKTLKVE
jgi:hypothetical protein